MIDNNFMTKPVSLAKEFELKNKIEVALWKEFKIYNNELNTQSNREKIVFTVDYPNTLRNYDFGVNAIVSGIRECFPRQHPFILTLHVNLLVTYRLKCCYYTEDNKIFLSARDSSKTYCHVFRGYNTDSKPLTYELLCKAITEENNILENSKCIRGSFQDLLLNK